MARRFTDTNKWRNPWFRSLPEKAKLVWIFLCDECDHCGIWKADFKLASVQVGFKFNTDNLIKWFGNKVYVFNTDNVLITQFFEYQYSGCKDNWTAKVKAKQKLEALGFCIENDKVILSKTTVVPQSPHCLVVDVVEVVVKEEGGVGETNLNLDALYQLYPLKKGKTAGLRTARSEIKTEADYKNLKAAIEAYKADLEKNKTEQKYIKHFSTFINNWRDWLEPDAGTATLKLVKSESELWLEEQIAKEAVNGTNV